MILWALLSGYLVKMVLYSVVRKAEAAALLNKVRHVLSKDGHGRCEGLRSQADKGSKINSD